MTGPSYKELEAKAYAAGDYTLAHAYARIVELEKALEEANVTASAWRRGYDAGYIEGREAALEEIAADPPDDQDDWAA